MVASAFRYILISAAAVAATAGGVFAQTAPAPILPAATQSKVAQDVVPTPSPTPDPFTFRGYVRSYYFTRQNASNNPGVQFDFDPGAKYNSNAVNQSSWNNGVSLHADYTFPDLGGLYIGGSYFYGNPINGECTVAATHAKGSPCVSKAPPNTNPDDTLPGFAMSTFPEAYLGFKASGLSVLAGNQLFNTPWANPSDSRIKPAAFQGADVSYVFDKSWTFEAADMWQFENRTTSNFGNTTLLTSFPAGGGGMGANIYVPGGGNINTAGFAMGHVGYAPAGSPLTVNGYFYGVSDLVNMWWFDGKYTWQQPQFKPFIALQGGTESNSGLSYIGKIRSSDIGVQIGANVNKNIVVSAGFDSIPWQNDTVNLPKGATCNNSNYQISTKGVTLGYFLPGNGGSSGQAGVCQTNANGTTDIYYGGWASPYTDNYATDPFFTTSISQGMADRRAPGTSYKIAATFTSNNKRWVFLASDAWYDYSNALAPENTNEWNLDGQYHFSQVKGKFYHGLLLRYRYAQRSESNAFCGDAGASCPASLAVGTSYLGGLPLFKYNRAQIEYDF